jgi:hypothetical protein
MPKPERPAYDVENRQNPSGMHQRALNTMSLPCVKSVRTSASLEESLIRSIIRNKKREVILLGISQQTIYR